MTHPIDMQQWFSLTPVDSWFFGDGRPNNVGEDQAGIASLFPPPAPTVAGAIRAAAARGMGWRSGAWGPEIRERLGDGDDLGPLRFTGPFLRKENSGETEVLLPAPANLLGRVEGGRWVPADLLVPGHTRVRTDLGPEALSLPERAGLFSGQEKLSPAEGIWLTSRGFEAVLSGRLPQQADWCAAGDLFVFEPRIGLEREAATRTAKEGGLYSPVHVRLRRGVSIVVGVSGLPGDFMPPPLLPFGGESRLARLDRIDPPQMPESSRASSSVQTVVLLTPARLLDADGAGWKVPGPGAPASDLSPELSGTVESLCLPRPIRIGGWDSVRGTPRPLEPYASAGTVWFLRDADGAPDSLAIGTRTAFGFGHALVGRASAASTL
jgi:CRISPR-associated protein Cmr3